MLLTILIFLAVLFVLILVHEWGHYITAKLTGMRVDVFAIGFPPKLISWKKGETEYSLNAIPIGGFVRIYGEDPTQVATTGPDSARAFGARPKWAQAVVLVAGVTMNVVFAWFLFVVILLIGVPTQVEEGQATDQAALTVLAVLPGSPADGEIPPNVQIAKVSSPATTLEQMTPSQVSDFIATSGGEPVTVTFMASNHTEQTVTVIPKLGLIADSPDRAAMGISLGLIEVVQRPFVPALGEAWTLTVDKTKAVANGLWGLLTAVVAGHADFSQVSGPIGIVSYVGSAAATGFTTLLLFTAVISLNLAVVNMLPIPALDGGRLVFVAIETITRRPIPPVWAARVNLAGFAFLMLLMLAATVNDVLKLW